MSAPATQNELVINWQFRTKLNKVHFIDEYVRTAVDEGTVVVRVGWKRQTKKHKVKVPLYQYRQASSEEEMVGIQELLTLKQTNPRGFLEEVGETDQAAIAYFEETEIPVIATVVGSEEIEEEEILENQPILNIMDPENIFIDPSVLDGDINNAGFVVVSFETSKAELIKDGRYKNLGAVNWSGAEILSQPDHKTETPADFNFSDDLRKRIVAYEYWGYYDIHKTDELVPIVATWIGDTLVRMEENPFPDEKPPFVVVPYLPVRRQLMGEPDAEILEDNQQILGAVTRGMIDLLGRSANAQQGMAKGFLDVTNRRRFDKGMDYEFNPGAGSPATAVHQHIYPEIPNSAVTMINFQNSEAEAMSGVKSFSGGLSGEAYGDVATGIKGVLDAAAKREMNILRRLAKGMVDIGNKLMAMNAVFLSEEETIRVTNQKFVTVRREDLKGNFDLVVDIATAEVDMSRSQDLGFMLQTMGPDMDPEMSRMILAEIAELKRMPALAHKIKTYQPEPDPLEVEAKQLGLAKLKAEIAEIESRTAENNAQARKYQSEADASDLEYVEQESGTKHTRDLERQAEQARSHQDLEITKALVQPRKPDEAEPDVLAAVGYNEMSDPNSNNQRF